MTDLELDAVYTRLCNTMTAIGAEQAPLFLARFALLAIERVGDRGAIDAMIGAAAESLGETARFSPPTADA